MNTKQKYVRLKEHDSFIIFPCIVEHSTFKGRNPVSAGFCYINANKKRVDCFGKSHSLNLKSDVREDTMKATKQFFGVDAMLKLIHDIVNEPSHKTPIDYTLENAADLKQAKLLIGKKLKDSWNWTVPFEITSLEYYSIPMSRNYQDANYDIMKFKYKVDLLLENGGRASVTWFCSMFEVETLLKDGITEYVGIFAGRKCEIIK